MYRIGELLLYYNTFAGDKGLVRVTSNPSSYKDINYVYGKVVVGLNERMHQDIGTSHNFALEHVTRCPMICKGKYGI